MEIEHDKYTRGHYASSKIENIEIREICREEVNIFYKLNDEIDREKRIILPIHMVLFYLGYGELHEDYILEEPEYDTDVKDINNPKTGIKVFKNYLLQENYIRLKAIHRRCKKISHKMSIQKK